MTEDIKVGIITALRAHVHELPNDDSEIACKLRYLTEVEIDPIESTEEYYKIYTATGAQGFCLKTSVEIKE